MNTKKTLKNSIVSSFAFVVNLVLQFIGRRIFVVFLDVELLGYQSLFNNVFSLLSVAELGFGSVISFHLYKELANCEQDEIGKLMFLYKWIYRVIALVVLIFGLVCMPFLPSIVRDAKASWDYLYIIYTLQLISVVAGYFLSYRRTIYYADQREYEYSVVDLYVEFFSLIIQIAVLAIFRTYILYLCIQLGGKILANLIIYLKTNHDYPYLKNKYSISKADIENRNIIPDLKNFIVHKISYTVYSCVDNVVISAFCGIRDVALYGNYFILQQGVVSLLLYKVLAPIQAAVGNIVYSNRPRDDMWEQFLIFDVFSFFFACYVGTGFIVFFQPAIQIWMGKEYLLPFSFVAAFSLTIYYTSLWDIVGKYRSSFGDFAKDRNCMFLSAVLNIAVSLFFVRLFGVTGVQIGTLCAFFPMAYGRIRFVVRDFFGKSIKTYLLRHAGLSFVFLVEGVACCLLTRGFPLSVGGIALRFVVWASIPMAVNLLIFCRDPHFKGLCGYLLNAFHIIEDKITAKSKKQKD